VWEAGEDRGHDWRVVVELWVRGAGGKSEGLRKYWGKSFRNILEEGQAFFFGIVENTNNAYARRVRLQLNYYLKHLAHF
jgi:hypothetical protein